MNNQIWDHYGVRAVDEHGPVAVAVGDYLYHHEDKTPVLNCDSRGLIVGRALEEMAPGERRVIKVGPAIVEAPAEEPEQTKGKNHGKPV